MGEYIYRKGLNPTANPDSFNKILYPFLELTSVIILTKEEKIWAILLSVLFLITLAYAVYFKIRLRNFGKFDVFFSVFVLMLFVYFNQPGQMAGAGVLTVRLQFIPFLMLLLWFANINFNITIKKIFVGIVFTIGLILTIIRYPHHKLASEAIEEYLTVQGHIEDKSTVLPLSFSHRGKTPEGKYIADRIGLFKHASDYLGADKSLILFGNYEANTGYFPLIWKKEKNPFRNISTNQGIEYQPPSVDIINYHTKTGGEIDYVITWCLDEKFMEHEYTKNTLQQLEMEYVLHFTSINGRVKLYKKKLRS